MSATHFSVMPVIALQLSVLTEKYRRAIESECAGREEQAAGELATLLSEASHLALVIAPLWTEWGQLTLAHNELQQQLMKGAKPEAVREALRRVTVLSSDFITRCVNWALFEQSRPSVPFHTADAFIASEGARRSAWQLREQIETFMAESGLSETPRALAEITAQAEGHATQLLVRAVLLLEGGEGAAESTAD